MATKVDVDLITDVVVNFVTIIISIFILCSIVHIIIKGIINRDSRNLIEKKRAKFKIINGGKDKKP